MKPFFDFLEHIPHRNLTLNAKSLQSSYCLYNAKNLQVHSSMHLIRVHCFTLLLFESYLLSHTNSKCYRKQEFTQDTERKQYLKRFCIYETLYRQPKRYKILTFLVCYMKNRSRILANSKDSLMQW